MTTLTLGNTPPPTVPLQERYRPVEKPQNAELQSLLALWHERPQEGFEIGRDIPSRRFAPFLSHISFWEPVDGGVDYTLRLGGEALRLRFGNDATGRGFRDLIAPEATSDFLEIGRRMLVEDYCACFDVHLLRQEPIGGRRELHFEFVIFPVWTHGRTGRWILNGTYYFF
jgi:hypothetical protein